MQLNLEKPKKVAEKNGIAFDKMVVIDLDKRLVTVSLKDKSSYSYSYFNDVDVKFYTDDIYYIFTINKRI